VDPNFKELFSYIKSQVGLLQDGYPMKNVLTAEHTVLSKFYSFTDSSAYYLLSVLFDLDLSEHTSRKKVQ
jgi:hypothetical protein